MATVLIFVVNARAPASVSFPDDLVNLVCALSFIELNFWSKRCESLLELMKSLRDTTLKTRQVFLALAHHLNENDDLLIVLMKSLIAFNHVCPEPLKAFSLKTTQ